MTTENNSNLAAGERRQEANAIDSRAAAKVKKPVPKADKYIMAIYIAILVISVIELYSASGLLIEKVADNNISTDNLSKGIYIVKSGKKTMKIAL